MRNDATRAELERALDDAIGKIHVLEAEKKLILETSQKILDLNDRINKEDKRVNDHNMSLVKLNEKMLDHQKKVNEQYVMTLAKNARIEAENISLRKRLARYEDADPQSADTRQKDSAGQDNASRPAGE